MGYAIHHHGSVERHTGSFTMRNPYLLDSIEAAQSVSRPEDLHNTHIKRMHMCSLYLLQATTPRHCSHLNDAGEGQHPCHHLYAARVDARADDDDA